MKKFFDSPHPWMVACVIFLFMTFIFRDSALGGMATMAGAIHCGVIGYVLAWRQDVAKLKEQREQESTPVAGYVPTTIPGQELTIPTVSQIMKRVEEAKANKELQDKERFDRIVHLVLVKIAETLNQAIGLRPYGFVTLDSDDADYFWKTPGVAAKIRESDPDHFIRYRIKEPTFFGIELTLYLDPELDYNKMRVFGMDSLGEYVPKWSIPMPGQKVL